MSPDKAVFEAGEPKAGSETKIAHSEHTYSGREKRKYHRRSNKDRRSGVRFSEDGDRRKHAGRRHTDAPDKPW